MVQQYSVEALTRMTRFGKERMGKKMKESRKVCGIVSDAEAKEKEIDALNDAIESAGGF